jgi:hypothetical protein
MPGLYQNLTDIKQDVIGIREVLGDPRLKQLVFEYPIDGKRYLVVTPQLVVTKPPDRMIGLPLDSKSSIMVNAEDYYIKNVSRNVPEAALKTRAWLDPKYNDSGVIISGINCRCHYINDKSGLSYDLILRKEREVRL